MKKEDIKYEISIKSVYLNNERYRFLYKKVWDMNKKTIVCIAFNPSKGDLFFNDMTLDRLTYEFQNKYGGIEVLNLFSIMQTKLSSNYCIKNENINKRYIMMYIRNRKDYDFFIGWGNSFNYYPNIYVNEGKERKGEIENLFAKLKMKSNIYCYRSQWGKALHPSRYSSTWKVQKYFLR